jgi:hypothetical protein
MSCCYGVTLNHQHDWAVRHAVGRRQRTDTVKSTLREEMVKKIMKNLFSVLTALMVYTLVTYKGAFALDLNTLGHNFGDHIFYVAAKLNPKTSFLLHTAYFQNHDSRVGNSTSYNVIGSGVNHNLEFSPIFKRVDNQYVIQMIVIGKDRYSEKNQAIDIYRFCPDDGRLVTFERTVHFDELLTDYSISVFEKNNDIFIGYPDKAALIKSLFSNWGMSFSWEEDKVLRQSVLYRNRRKGEKKFSVTNIFLEKPQYGKSGYTGSGKLCKSDRRNESLRKDLKFLSMEDILSEAHNIYHKYTAVRKTYNFCSILLKNQPDSVKDIEKNWIRYQAKNQKLFSQYINKFDQILFEVGIQKFYEVWGDRKDSADRLNRVRKLPENCEYMLDFKNMSSFNIKEKDAALIRSFKM